MLAAEGMRLATWAADFSRDGPGLLLRQILQDPYDLAPALDAMAAARADVLLLTDIDHDHDLVALSALRDLLRARGLDYAHLHATRPNTGMATGLDLDGDGRLGGPRDAMGYGQFSGQGGQAILSRHPLVPVADLTDRLWQDVPDSAMAPDDPGAGVQRLSSTAHWAVRVDGPVPVTLLTVGATPPVFDGPEDRNGRRNRDEVLMWAHVLDGRLPGMTLPDGPVALIGNLNLDPDRGDGLREAVQTILAHPRLTDPLPGVPTVTWRSTGPMRVSYILPDAALAVTGAGVAPPVEGAGPHGLVWVDIAPRGGGDG